MRRRIKEFIFIMFCIKIFIYANDTYVSVAGGTMATPALNQNNDIQMVSERIYITLFDDYYETEVNFVFYNHGNNQTIIVGFPQWTQGTQKKEEFIEFETSLNGRPIEFTESFLENPNNIGKNIFITKWFLRKINFPSNEYTTTRVKYKTPYGTYGNGADYLFGTGSTWKDEIKEINIQIDNQSSKWINAVHVGQYNQFESFQNSNGIIETTLYNKRPSITDTIFIEADYLPFGLMARYPYFSTEELKQYELEYLSKEQLRILRNIIFAKHGHIFKSEDINEWLEEYCSYWYVPEGIVNAEDLSQIEQYNIQKIVIEEGSR